MSKIITYNRGALKVAHLPCSKINTTKRTHNKKEKRGSGLLVRWGIPNALSASRPITLFSSPRSFLLGSPRILFLIHFGLQIGSLMNPFMKETCLEI